MGGDDEWVMAVQRRGQAEAQWNVVTLGRKSAEQTIKNDQNAAIVLIQILWVGCVMDAMVRGGVEHPLQWTQLGNPGRVLPELVQQIDRQHPEDRKRCKTQPQQRRKKTGRFR